MTQTNNIQGDLRQAELIEEAFIATLFDQVA
jgi:hypothetical protein